MTLEDYFKDSDLNHSRHTHSYANDEAEYHLTSKKKPGVLKRAAMTGLLALSILGSSITKPVIRAVNHYAFKDNPPIVMVQAENAKFGMTGCAGPTTPEPPPPNKVKVYATLNAKDCFTGVTIPAGQVSYQPPTGSAVVKNLGEQAYLGEINPNTTMNVDITITVGGYLKRVFNDVALSGTKTMDTTLLDLNGFNLEGYTSYFLNDLGNASMGWINGVWDQPSFTGYFNPDKLTELRLSPEYIQATMDAVNEIALYSKGFINSVSFIETGNKPDDTTVPPDKDGWIFRDSEASGVHNLSYPLNGTTVKSLKLWYNMSSSIPERVRAEVMDAFIQGNQNIFQEEYVAKYFEFSLKHRPKGTAYSYKIFLDREEQTGFDGIIASQATVYSSTPSDNPDDYTVNPDSTIGGYGGYSSPDYSTPKVGGRQDAGAATKGSRGQAAEKERIRN